MMKVREAMADKRRQSAVVSRKMGKMAEMLEDANQERADSESVDKEEVRKQSHAHVHTAASRPSHSASPTSHSGAHAIISDSSSNNNHCWRRDPTNADKRLILSKWTSCSLG